MDSKSIGLCPQGFESPRCRYCICSLASGRFLAGHLGTSNARSSRSNVTSEARASNAKWRQPAPSHVSRQARLPHRRPMSRSRCVPAGVSHSAPPCHEASVPQSALAGHDAGVSHSTPLCPEASVPHSAPLRREASASRDYLAARPAINWHGGARPAIV